MHKKIIIHQQSLKIIPVDLLFRKGKNFLLKIKIGVFQNLLRISRKVKVSVILRFLSQKFSGTAESVHLSNKLKTKNKWF